MVIISNFEALYNIVKSKVDKRRVISVLLGGCSRVGKSELAKRLMKRCQEGDIPTLHVKLDAWLVSVEKRKVGSTVMERYQTERIVKAVEDLLNGQQIHSPVYNPQIRRRILEESKISLKPPSFGILFLDGIIALSVEPLRRLSSLAIYVDVLDDLRKKRLYDFYNNFKCLGLKEAQKVIEERESEEVPFIKANSRNADFIYCEEKKDNSNEQ